MAEKVFDICGPRDSNKPWIWGLVLEVVICRDKEKWSVNVVIEHNIAEKYRAVQ